MKKTIFICLAFISTLMIQAEINKKPFVIPEVQQWIGAEGTVALDLNDTHIVIGKEKPELRRVAELLSEDIHYMFGTQPEIVVGKARKGDIELSLGRKMAKEAYVMTTTDKVAISAYTEQGLYWGTRTLLQIAEQSKEHSIPCGTIKDEPEYAIRGFMIDCGRKFFPMNYLQNLVKVMAYYKMNTLQVHLNDNGFKQFFQNDWDKTYAAFRMESTTFPELTAQDGSYSKQEFHDFIKESANIGVEIIPEIDAPAHTLAFSHFKQELGSKEYGLDHMDLFNPETYNFLDALFKEYLEGDDPVFCSPRIHIGTDEYSNRDSVVVEKFRYFTDRYIRYVESFGKQACIWGSLTHAKGKTPIKVKDVVMSAWSNGYAQPKDMAQLGYKMISIPDGYTYIVPAAGYYYDYLNCQMLYENWTPANVGGEIFPERDPHILGGMFAVWNDHCGNGISVSDVHHRLFPGLQTIAVKCWSASKVTLDYAAFDSGRKQLSEAPGVNELGRYKGKINILQMNELRPNTEIDDADFIGYNYRVSFDIDGKEDVRGTELLSSSRSTFYLSDPISGMLGFSRDGYLYTFSYKVRNGEKQNIAIEGDNKATRLFINGKLFEELNTRPIWYQEGKAKVNQTRTLVFPLHKAGDFKSKITNLKADQL